MAREPRRSRSLEQAEIRKLEAETAEIEARTKERRLRTLLAGACLVAFAVGHVFGAITPDRLHGGENLIGRLLRQVVLIRPPSIR